MQVYNAAEALPNLIDPFWMLPLPGVLGPKARDVVGFTSCSCWCTCRWCWACCGRWPLMR